MDGSLREGPALLTSHLGRTATRSDAVTSKTANSSAESPGLVLSLNCDAPVTPALQIGEPQRRQLLQHLASIGTTL
jgi:hypothetical protein